MNKTAIQRFAIWARTELIAQVSQRAYQYGITADGYGDDDAEAVGGRLLSDEEKKQRRQLIGQIRSKGYAQVMEEVAYTWFNRLIALRFMEVNNYLPSHIRVFSDASGVFKPEILSDALHLDLDGLDMKKVSDLIEKNQSEALYRYLLLTQCNALSGALPRMFEPMGSYTELLLPNNILRQDGVLGRMVTDIPEEDWTDQVQIIGWLYQYYNDERKNEVINIYKGTVKKEDIPAATQLFTTDWVVRYMVDNSLGRFWIERHPESKLSDKLEFFVTPKDGKIEYINDPVRPEEVKLFDPCMGSGHILVYAFDVLIEIYKESGYSERDAAALIVQNNLFGLDIDDRASQLAYFAVMMKARSYDRRFLNRGIKPNVYAIQESNGMDTVVRGGLTPDAKMNAIGQYLVDTFKDAKELGSVIAVEQYDYDSYLAYLDGCEADGQLSLEDSKWLTDTRKILKEFACQAKVLSSRYHVVCTNPPYLNKIEGNLKTIVTREYRDYSGDLFSVFIYRNLQFCLNNGYCAFMTPFVWMFIDTYEKLRNFIIKNKSISTLIQMEYSAYEEATVPICSFVIKNGKENSNGCYFRLSAFRGGMDVQRQKVIEALINKDCGYYYEISIKNFTIIPGNPISYWGSDTAVNKYLINKTVGDIAFVKKGMFTGQNDLFFRSWYEVSYPAIDFGITDARDVGYRHYVPMNSGGTFRRWYGNRNSVIKFDKEHYDMITANKGHRNPQFYFKKAAPWTKITSGKFSMRISEVGFINNDASMAAYEKSVPLEAIVGLMNSSIAQYYLGLVNESLNYTSGNVASVPFALSDKEAAVVASFVKECVSISKSDWDTFETSWDFEIHPIVKKALSRFHLERDGAISIEYVYKYVVQDFEERFQNLKTNEEELNRIFIDIYGLQDELTPEVEDKDVTVRRADLGRDIRSLISYAVGCMFGRYSLDVEGLILAGQEYGSRFVSNPLGYSLGVPAVLVGNYIRTSDNGTDVKECSFLPDQDNIIPICDDEYFDDDITGRFVAWVEVVFGKDTLEENLKYIAGALGGKGTPREVIRGYFLNDFYADHLKIYQKRPIYWLFDSGKKNGFKALIYMHRYRSDLLARMRTDYVHEQQERYRTQLKHIGDAMDAASAPERVKLAKRQKKLQEQALELQKYEEKIHHLADQNIEIDLDDGVKHNYALFEDVLAKIR